MKLHFRNHFTAWPSGGGGGLWREFGDQVQGGSSGRKRRNSATTVFIISSTSPSIQSARVFCTPYRDAYLLASAASLLPRKLGGCVYTYT